jgi:hypothetical protein
VRTSTNRLAQEKLAPIIEVLVGRSGFIDEVWDYFITIGGGVRWFVTPRLAVGPEVAHLTGEFDGLEASHLSATGNVTCSISSETVITAVSYRMLLPAEGPCAQRTLVGRGPGVPGLAPFTSSEGTVSAGIGARVAIGARVFIAPEFRLGWEPETRIAATVGLRTR